MFDSRLLPQSSFLSLHRVPWGINMGTSRHSRSSTHVVRYLDVRASDKAVDLSQRAATSVRTSRGNDVRVGEEREGVTLNCVVSPVAFQILSTEKSMSQAMDPEASGRAIHDTEVNTHGYSI